MEFRPCIDIHNGSVKQIVGSSLSDLGDYARENFVSGQDAKPYEPPLYIRAQTPPPDEDEFDISLPSRKLTRFVVFF